MDRGSVGFHSPRGHCGAAGQLWGGGVLCPPGPRGMCQDPQEPPRGLHSLGLKQESLLPPPPLGL